MQGEKKTNGEKLCNLQGERKVNLWYWIIISDWEQLETKELCLWKRWLLVPCRQSKKRQAAFCHFFPAVVWEATASASSGNLVKMQHRSASEDTAWWESAFSRVPGCYLEMLEIESHHQNVWRRVRRKKAPSSSVDKAALSFCVFVYPIIILIDTTERKWIKVTATLQMRCERMLTSDIHAGLEWYEI